MRIYSKPTSWIGLLESVTVLFLGLFLALGILLETGLVSWSVQDKAKAALEAQGFPVVIMGPSEREEPAP